MTSLVSPSSAQAMSSLPIRPQLFLWAIRHLILAVGNQQPVCAHVHKTFEIADIPMLPFLIEELLHTVAQHANRRLEFNHPSSSRLLPDEQRFLACLQALLRQPSECGCKHLSGMVNTASLDKIMPRFALVAATLQNCRPSPAGWPIHQSAHSPTSSPARSPVTSATVH